MPHMSNLPWILILFVSNLVLLVYFTFISHSYKPKKDHRWNTQKKNPSF